ncbi:hypothetical protein AAG906_026488 [Vitis piasezkii]
MFRFELCFAPSLFQRSLGLASLEFSLGRLVGQVLTACRRPRPKSRTSSPTPTHGSSQLAPNVRLVASVTDDNDKNLLVVATRRCFLSIALRWWKLLGEDDTVWKTSFGGD